MCAGMVRVARPTASGSPCGFPASSDQPSPRGATVTTVRTASQAIRRAVCGWIGPTPPNSAGAAPAPARSLPCAVVSEPESAVSGTDRSVAALTVSVRWGRWPCTSR